MLREDVQTEYDHFLQMIKRLSAPKKVSQDELLDVLLNDEDFQQILLSRKYVYSDSKVYLLDPKFISASLVQSELSDEELKDAVLRLDGNYKIVYEKNKTERIKNTLKQAGNILKYCLVLPFNLLDDLFERIVDYLVDRFDVEYTRAPVHNSHESILKIRSGEKRNQL